MILKVLLVALVVGIVYFIFIKKKPLKKPKEDKNTRQEESNDMVACTTCGTYAELSDTLISSNKYYCSPECMEKT